MTRRTPPQPSSDIGGRKGVALIMVLMVIVILTTISVEFQYESRVYLQTTGNFRDRQRAHYLARSAVEFSRLLLYLQNTVDQMLKRFMKNNTPNIQLWQLIPMDSDLIRAVAGGIFSMEAQEQLFEGTAVGRAEAQNDGTKTNPADQAQGLSFGEAEGFGNFEGHFNAEIVDEESKINLNVRPANTKEVNLMRASLEKLMAPIKYNPIFENPDSHGQYHDRLDIISAILDWIDPDTQRSGMDAGDEASRYDYLDDPYPNKNHFFDTLDEVQLVSGIDDRFWRLFGESLTVYRTAKININTCDVEIMRALLEQFLAPPVPADAEMQRIIDQIFAYRTEIYGFMNEEQFINYILSGPELKLELKDGGQGRKDLKAAITVKSGTFTIKASGDINGVMKTIKVVMTKDGQLLYYREE